MIDQSIFREYDIRGMVPEQLNDNSIDLIANAIAAKCKSESISELALGRDGRLSGANIMNNLSSSLKERGINIVNIGLVTSPLLYFAAKKYEVLVVDNFSKRKIEFETGVSSLQNIPPLKRRVDLWNRNSNSTIKMEMCDLLNHRHLYDILKSFKPSNIIHYAEQPSAPYSMMGREACFFTQHNNVMGNLNLLFAMKKNCPDAHLVKLGTMGEYGTPNIDIEEGWIDIEHNGRKDRVLYPKKPNSFYHLSILLV